MTMASELLCIVDVLCILLKRRVAIDESLDVKDVRFILCAIPPVQTGSQVAYTVHCV